MLEEAFGEVRWGVEAHHIAYFDNLVFACGEQLGAFYESYYADIVVRRLACDTFDAFVLNRTAHVEHPGEVVYVEIRIGEVVKDKSVEFFYEFCVFAFACIFYVGFLVVVQW